VHQLDIRAIVTRLNAKPLIRVESGSFVGRFGDQEYALGSTEAGVARAIRRMSQLRREIQAKVA
jgi:GGDEF domain-containing protein